MKSNIKRILQDLTEPGFWIGTAFTLPLVWLSFWIAKKIVLLIFNW